MSTIAQIENTIAAIMEDSETPYSDMVSIFIVERWDARHGKYSTHVNMSFDDVLDVDAWLNYNAPKYKNLRTLVEDMQEIFPGIPYWWLIERLFQYF